MTKVKGTRDNSYLVPGKNDDAITKQRQTIDKDGSVKVTNEKVSLSEFADRKAENARAEVREQVENLIDSIGMKAYSAMLKLLIDPDYVYYHLVIMAEKLSMDRNSGNPLSVMKKENVVQQVLDWLWPFDKGQEQYYDEVK